MHRSCCTKCIVYQYERMHSCAQVNFCWYRSRLRPVLHSVVLGMVYTKEHRGVSPCTTLFSLSLYDMSRHIVLRVVGAIWWLVAWIFACVVYGIHAGRRNEWFCCENGNSTKRKKDRVVEGFVWCRVSDGGLRIRIYGFRKQPVWGLYQILFWHMEV